MEDGELSDSNSSQSSIDNLDLDSKHISNNNLTQTDSNKTNKNKFQIWNSVIDEQILSSGLTGIGDSFTKEREIESYDFKRALLDGRPRVPSCTDEDDASIKIFKDKKNLADTLETFGVASGVHETVETYKSANRKRKSTNKSSVLLRKQFKSSKGSTFNPCKYVNDVVINTDDDNCMEDGQNRDVPVKCRLGYKKIEWNELRIDGLNEEHQVVDELMNVLQEPTHMKPTFVEIVSVLGVKRSLNLLKRTVEVEKNGGMLTLKCDRRRTPGGVYLYLLKSESNPEEQKKIFGIERLKFRYNNKKHKNPKRNGSSSSSSSPVTNIAGDCT